MKNGDNVNNQELKIIMSTNACWHCYYTANKKEDQFLMKCIRNDSFLRELSKWRGRRWWLQCYTVRCVVALELCFILVTKDAQPVGRLNPLSSHSLWRRRGSIGPLYISTTSHYCVRCSQLFA